MTRERAFYIVYRIGKYMNEREMQKQFELYEVCMYISDLANDILKANETGYRDFLDNYYNALKNEMENVKNNSEIVNEIEELFDLLDEWKD